MIVLLRTPATGRDISATGCMLAQGLYFIMGDKQGVTAKEAAKHAMNQSRCMSMEQR